MNWMVNRTTKETRISKIANYFLTVCSVASGEDMISVFVSKHKIWYANMKFSWNNNKVDIVHLFLSVGSKSLLDPMRLALPKCACHQSKWRSNWYKSHEHALYIDWRWSILHRLSWSQTNLMTRQHLLLLTSAATRSLLPLLASVAIMWLLYSCFDFLLWLLHLGQPFSATTTFYSVVRNYCPLLVLYVHTQQWNSHAVFSLIGRSITCFGVWLGHIFKDGCLWLIQVLWQNLNTFCPYFKH